MSITLNDNDNLMRRSPLATGNSTRYTYDACVNSRLTRRDGRSYTYTRRELDQETRLYHYRARYYDTVTGRFVHKDPIGSLC